MGISRGDGTWNLVVWATKMICCVALIAIYKRSGDAFYYVKELDKEFSK